LKQTLWQIDQQIEQILFECVDAETGEISDAASAELDSLNLVLNEKILNCGLVIDGHIFEAEGIERVMKELGGRAKQHRAHAAWLLNYVDVHTPPKFKLSDPRVVIDRSTSQRVELVEPDSVKVDADLLDAVDSNYLNAKTTYSIDKVGARKVMKTGEVIKGLVLRTYSKIRVKRGPAAKDNA
jgi:hypothetical protein